MSDCVVEAIVKWSVMMLFVIIYLSAVTIYLFVFQETLLAFIILTLAISTLLQLAFFYAFAQLYCKEENT